MGASDVDGDTLTVSLPTATGQGTITGPDAGGEYTYTAGSAFTGVETIRVTVSDGNGGSVTRDVSFDVVGGEPQRLIAAALPFCRAHLALPARPP